MTIPRVLSIAGSAAHGSAGIQADLKTFQERDVYGMAAITAIVANVANANKNIFIQELEAIEAQYYTSVENVGVDAIKTGMLFSKEIIELVVKLLKHTDINNIVVDPVMIGKMGSQLLKDDAIDSMIVQLFPLAKIITPNLHEAARITRIKKIDSVADMREAAKRLYELGPDNVLIKGGALKNAAIDLLYNGKEFVVLEVERIPTVHTSGAGCSYSAAIAAEISKGKSVEEAVRLGKKYVTAAIKHALAFNKGIGSTYHAAYRKSGEE
ncbi:bifunctional hydroxymethylpyrimidine kinase/phosphomethylpyrimidine kinase [Radiobacillus sp. PE A8.2]|uniref:bifunctional hydroxymethylpyrimidine kinase/phosphomethylpyrimidine kinase n=1 Tax=Radiobacillus sp. PE A8.2 TaxID=3380349 RepID=UPI00388E73E9